MLRLLWLRARFSFKKDAIHSFSCSIRQERAMTKPLKQLFNEARLNKTAKQQGFCKRLRDIRPLELFFSPVSAFGDGIVGAIANLHRTLNGIHMISDANVAYKPLHKKFCEQEFAEFMQTFVTWAIAFFG